MNRLFTLLQTFLGALWNFFRLPFPATNIPIGALLFLPMVISLALALFRNLFGVGGFAQIGSTKASYRNAESRNPDNRKRR